MNGQTDRPQDDARQSEQQEVAGDAEEVQGHGGDADDQPENAGDASIEELQAQADENWDRYLRAAAELDNVRKRAARDVERARKYALESFAKEMLVVRDSFEMGIEAAESAESAETESLAEGNRATLKLLTSVLERFGVSEVDPLGEPFDPELHEAISMQASPDAEPGTVLVVVQKGYALNGRLLRPAMVVVAAEGDGQ